jgi:hypothetical protein
MYELKRVHGHDRISQTSGAPVGPNTHYKPPAGKQFRNAANHRANLIAEEYKAKAVRTDRKYGAPGSTQVQDALENMPKVRGLAIGAFGEFSDSIITLIKGMAYEGARKNAARFGQTDQTKAQSMIAWWLKKRWNRLSLITAVESRYDAMRYVGGSAQQQAADLHRWQQQQEDEFVREDGRFFRDQQAQNQHW